MFTDPSGSLPLLETATGAFNFQVSKTADYYVRRKLGSCLSDFTKIHIEVTHDNLELGNVITPNGDGLNDYWMVNGLPDYKGNSIKIYTRGGQLVYESIGNYTKPFTGVFRDKELPAGVYFYVIDLRAECKPISGSITLLRQGAKNKEQRQKYQVSSIKYRVSSIQIGCLGGNEFRTKSKE